MCVDNVAWRIIVASHCAFFYNFPSKPQSLPKPCKLFDKLSKRYRLFKLFVTKIPMQGRGFEILLIRSSETSKNDSRTSGIPAGLVRRTTAYFWFSHKLHWLYIFQTSEWYIQTSDFYDPLAGWTIAFNLKFRSLQCQTWDYDVTWSWRMHCRSLCFTVTVQAKNVRHVGHFRWLGPNVWWEISQICMEYIKSIRQMSGEPWKFFAYTAVSPHLWMCVALTAGWGLCWGVQCPGQGPDCPLETLGLFGYQEGEEKLETSVIYAQCSRLSWKSCQSWSEFWEIQTLICKEMCKKLLVLTKSCRSRTNGPALVSNTVYAICTCQQG